MSKNPGRVNPLAAAERADRKRKILIQVAVAAVLVVLVAVIGVSLAMRGDDGDVGPTPAAAASDGVIVIGSPTAKTTVRIVADLQCPICQLFEAAHDQMLREAVANGSTQIHYDIIAFLDKASSTEYSSRAANASYCVADTGTENYQNWIAAMFAQQPPEGGAGLPDEKLIEIARQAGYTDPSIEGCITDRKYDRYIANRTREVLSGEIDGTPTVFVNGEKVELKINDQRQFDTAPLRSALEAAAGR